MHNLRAQPVRLPGAPVAGRVEPVRTTQGESRCLIASVYS